MCNWTSELHQTTARASAIPWGSSCTSSDHEDQQGWVLQASLSITALRIYTSLSVWAWWTCFTWKHFFFFNQISKCCDCLCLLPGQEPSSRTERCVIYLPGGELQTNFIAFLLRPHSLLIPNGSIMTQSVLTKH